MNDFVKEANYIVDPYMIQCFKAGKQPKPLFKRTFIRRAYTALKEATSKIYHDNDWSAVRNIEKIIRGVDPQVELFFNRSEYRGTLGETGHRKVFEYIIAGCVDKDIRVQVIASFCGTVKDPTNAYDLTVIMN